VLMTSFAGLTLLLAAMGLYGTLAQRVSERTREIGVRLALGALPSQVFRLVMTEGVWLVGSGVAIGAGVVWIGVPLIKQSLFGVSAGDGWTYAGIAVVLGSVTILASALPSRLAARTNPVTAIRGE
jgi:putative ABC transport system permease protein